MDTPTDLEIDEIWKQKRARNVSVSPDGSTLIFTVKSAVKSEDEWRKTMYAADLDSVDESVRVLTERRIKRPKWDPTGRRLAFLLNGHAWTVDFDGGGGLNQVTELETGIKGYDWGPEGERLVVETYVLEDDNWYSNNEHLAGNVAIIDSIDHKLKQFPPNRRSHLAVVDAKTGAAESLDESRVEFPLEVDDNPLEAMVDSGALQPRPTDE